MPRPDLIRVVWDGAALVPDGNHATATLHDHLGAGEVRLIDIDPERSGATHNHQFAFVRRAWESLPEHVVDLRWASTPETLRKHALCLTGYCTTEMVAVGDGARAARVAAALRRALTGGEYKLVDASGPVVVILTPESQSKKAMGRDRFQASKQAIGEWLADLLGVPTDELMRVEKK